MWLLTTHRTRAQRAGIVSGFACSHFAVFRANYALAQAPRRARRLADRGTSFFYGLESAADRARAAHTRW